MKKNIQKMNAELAWNINKAIFVARVRCGLTQEQLAKKVGTQQSGIARLENSTSLPSLSMLQKIANALDQKIIFVFQPKNPHDVRFFKPKPTEEKFRAKIGAQILRASRDAAQGKNISGPFTTADEIVAHLKS